MRFSQFIRLYSAGLGVNPTQAESSCKVFAADPECSASFTDPETGTRRGADVLPYSAALIVAGALSGAAQRHVATAARRLFALSGGVDDTFGSTLVAILSDPRAAAGVDTISYCRDLKFGIIKRFGKAPEYFNSSHDAPDASRLSVIASVDGQFLAELAFDLQAA